jgi:hypothetical protein
MTVDLIPNSAEAPWIEFGNGWAKIHYMRETTDQDHAALTAIFNGITDNSALAEELREFTAMKYAGDCKCGKCQLVPRALVERIYHTLNSSNAVAQASSEALHSANAARRDTWQPIGTAPKEGRFLALMHDGREPPNLYHEIIGWNDHGRGAGTWMNRNGSEYHEDAEAKGYCRPLFWQPLPPILPTVRDAEAQSDGGAS